MRTAAKTAKTSSKAIASPEALAAIAVLRVAGFIKRTSLQKLMGERLGRAIGDDAFEAAMTALGRGIIRVRGIGGGICLA
jgi:hypothetical protein